MPNQNVEKLWYKSVTTEKIPNFRYLDGYGALTLRKLQCEESNLSDFLKLCTVFASSLIERQAIEHIKNYQKLVLCFLFQGLLCTNSCENS